MTQLVGSAMYDASGGDAVYAACWLADSVQGFVPQLIQTGLAELVSAKGVVLASLDLSAPINDAGVAGANDLGGPDSINVCFSHPADVGTIVRFTVSAGTLGSFRCEAEVKWDDRAARGVPLDAQPDDRTGERDSPIPPDGPIQGLPQPIVLDAPRDPDPGEEY